MKARTIRRRSFLTLLGVAAAAWPPAARAQPAERMRRIAFLSGAAENLVASRAQRAAFQEGLAKLGWIEGRNLRVDYRFGAGDLDNIRAYAAELVNLAPEVLVTNSGATTRAAQRATQIIPIVFSQGGDAEAVGLVQNITRPEGNTTGFSTTEPSVAGKWVELLKEAAPHVSRIAVLVNPETAVTGPSYIASIEAAAAALSVQAIKTPFRDAVDIVHAIDTFATAPNGGLIVLPPTPPASNFNAILRLAAQHRLPSVHSFSAAAGGLMSYASDRIDVSRRAATYVDRLLRGAKVSDLPVQFPTKYELVINLKAANAIGLTIPEALLLRADQLIE